jgi:hypothetical protein
MQSLERQGQSATDSSKKASYANRIEFFPFYLGIKSSDSINKISLRYLFLKEVLPDMKDRTFYVVEANSMGAKIIIRNFVFYKNNSGITEVQLYTYYENTWHKKEKIQLQTFRFDDDLKKYNLKNWKGFNNDDVIITRLGRKETRLITSEFYLPGTLSVNSGIKQILDEDINPIFN